MTNLRARGTDAGLGRYLRSAFTYHWNLLAVSGAAVGALLLDPSTFLPIVAAVEVSYLALLVSIPRFRAAIDAEVHNERRTASLAPVAAGSGNNVKDLLLNLDDTARARFEGLRARCVEMRRLAAGVGGRTSDGGTGPEELRSDALDRMLWAFLRLLSSEQALKRFLSTTDPNTMQSKLAEQKARLAGLGATPDERISRALVDSIATLELRIGNYDKARTNAEFVCVELDRIEGKIQALTEMAVSRQDPDFLTRQVDSVAESMSQTEHAIRELQDITGLSEQIADAPKILDVDYEVER